MSRIWLATETALDRQVVIKVIAAELTEGLSAERFTREVRAQVLLMERQLAAADSVAAGTMALDSTFMLAWDQRAHALLALGQAAQAVALMERRVAASPPGRPEEAHGILAYAYAKAGQVRQARAMLDTMQARSGGRLPATGAIAVTLEELGDHEAAVALTAEAIARHDGWLVQFSRNPRCDRLRRDPRVAAMLAKLESKGP